MSRIVVSFKIRESDLYEYANSFRSPSIYIKDLICKDMKEKELCENEAQIQSNKRKI